MILKGFKEKSNKKYINSELKKRLVSESNKKIKTIGIIVNIDEALQLNWFNAIAHLLNAENKYVKLIAYTSEDKIKEASEVPAYNNKHLGWKGNVKHPGLKLFLDEEFDLLINYYTEDITTLKLFSVASKAKFKVGILQRDERINDLIIKTELSDFDTFKVELIKYLNILNKI